MNKNVVINALKSLPAIVVLALLAGCGSGSDGADGPGGAQGPQVEQGPPGDSGEPAGPVIANLSVLGSPVYPGGQVEVIVSAHSPTDETLSYSWTIPDGWQGSDEDSAMIILTAPDEQAARGTVGVAVRDGKYTRSVGVVGAPRGLAIDSSVIRWYDNASL